MIVHNDHVDGGCRVKSSNVAAPRNVVRAILFLNYLIVRSPRTLANNRRSFPGFRFGLLAGGAIEDKNLRNPNK
jgi:hypothetical protein